MLVHASARMAEGSSRILPEFFQSFFAVWKRRGVKVGFNLNGGRMR